MSKTPTFSGETLITNQKLNIDEHTEHRHSRCCQHTWQHLRPKCKDTMSHLKINEFLLYASKPNKEQVDDFNSITSTTIISTVYDTGQDHHNKVNHQVKHIKIIANTSKPTVNVTYSRCWDSQQCLWKYKIHKTKHFSSKLFSCTATDLSYTKP